MNGHRLPNTIHSVPEALAFWAERTPHAPALIPPDSPAITYADLWRRVGGLAESLNDAGIGRHDRVVLLMEEGPELAIALLGAMSAATAIPINASLTAAELDSALDGLGAAAAIVAAPPPTASRTCLAQHGVPICEFHTDDDPAGPTLICETGRPPQRGSRPRPADIATVLLTSGTTGKPKRVPSTHAGIMEDGRERRDLFGLHEHDRALAVAPLTLSLGLCVLFHAIAAGGALIFPPASDLPTLWATVAAQQPTWMFPSSGLVEVLTRFLRTQPATPQPSPFRLVRITAAPISPEICEELEQRLGATVLPSYSSTETGLIATALPPPATHKPGSVGQPIVELRVIGADEETAPPGVDGEIWLRGAPLDFAGYLDDAETNAAVLAPGGWFRTGDVGYLDEDGFLFLTGRLSQLINRGGDKISPAEVDAVLLAHPAVESAATFAIPDARWGEDIAAAVVLHNGQRATARDLRSWMLTRLSPHKVPRQIWFVPDLPRTELGKVQRGELCRLWLERHDHGRQGQAS